MPIGTIIVLRPVVRRQRLIAKYDDMALAERIIRREIWEGQTADELLDSLGRPAAIDVKKLKTKKKEIWKHSRENKRCFRLRVTFDDDIVVKWADRRQ